LAISEANAGVAKLLGIVHMGTQVERMMH